MATERLPVRQLRELFRQKFELSFAHRDIGRSLRISASSVSQAVSRARAAGVTTWAEVQAVTDTELEEKLYGAQTRLSGLSLPDFAKVHVELHRPGVTLQLVHLEYLETTPNGYRYTTFCNYYRAWKRKQNPVMRQVHEGGDKLFVDYSGKKAHIVDPQTGEVIDVEIFVAVLGASNYLYAEATLTQQVPDWIASHVRCFEALGGVPRAVVPDQLKSGVTISNRYEPGVQRSYEEMAQHYGTVIFPARPARPRDKSKVEVGVLIMQRWVLACLRNQTFFSLGELNERIRELCDAVNDKTMRTYGESRLSLFERLDKPALGPLPQTRFSHGEWKVVKVSIDYHVEYAHHYYSVPHALLGEKLDVRATSTTIEIFRKSERVASHARSHLRGRHTTCTEHMPTSHQKHLDWSPSRFVSWAEKIGVATAALVSAILLERRHPEQGYRSCLGILRLSGRYGEQRLEAACVRAALAGGRSYRHIDSILKHGLDRLANEAEPTLVSRTHENVRGRDYYH